MPRIARAVFAGIPHHVTQRGNRRGQVFFSDHDRSGYLQLLRRYAGTHHVEILAYCLMVNHVHLVVVPATADALYRMLRPLNMRHAQRINQSRGWKGHLWQGRYFSSALDEQYLWTAVRYVERNPIRVGMVARAEDYRWSSAAAHCGLRDDPVLTYGVDWRRLFQSIGDWSSWLAAGDEQQRLETLRRHADKGLPCGSAAFVDSLECVAGRVLRDRSPGRPVEVGDEKGDGTLLRRHRRVPSPF
jgi:putative transposase